MNIEIIGNQFYVNGIPQRFICGQMPGCNAAHMQANGTYGVFDKFGGNVKPSYLEKFESPLRQFNKQDKFVLIQDFNALAFRETAADGRDSGGNKYVWQNEEYPTRMDAFFSPEGWRMQKELIRKQLKIAKSINGLRFAFSAFWEGQTIPPKYQKHLMAWLQKFKKIVNSHGVLAGVHSHVKKHYKQMDFVVYEGNFAKFRPIKIWGNFPAFCIHRNQGIFNPKKKASNFKKTWQEILRAMQLEMIAELRVNHCTAEPFERYVNQKKLNREIGQNKFDCNEFRKYMQGFILNISNELEKFQGKKLPIDFGQKFIYKKSESEPEIEKESPEKEEKLKKEDKPTVPISVVEEEVKMKNWYQKLWSGVSSWINKRIAKYWYIFVGIGALSIIAFIAFGGWTYTIAIASTMIFYIGLAGKFLK